MRAHELQRPWSQRQPPWCSVRFVCTNELQLSRAGVRRPLPRVCSVRTNELQRLSAYRHRPAGQGAPRAHQRITTQDFGTASVRFSGCALCAPTNYNTMRVIRHKNRVGALHAHQRITTCMRCSRPRHACVARSVRTKELQRASRKHNRHPRRGALRAHQRITTGSSFQSYSDERWCAPCAPMNYNLTQNVTMTRPDGAPHTHQRITTAM